MKAGAVLCCLAVSFPVLVAAPPAQAAKENTAELQANLKKAADSSSPDSAELKPWHMKISAQLFDWKGTSTGTGTIEEWWMAPNNEKRVFEFPDYKGTEIITSDGVYRSAGLVSEPLFVADLVDQIVHPVAAEDKMTGIKTAPTARSLSIGGVNLPCIMLIKPNSRVENIPIGFYPAWCMEPGKSAIRAYIDDGGIAVVRNQISSFQGKDVPMELMVGLNGATLASGRVTEISLDGMPSSLFTPDSSMNKLPPHPVELKGKKFENQAAKRVEPDFTIVRQQTNPFGQPMSGNLQGDTEVRLWVGEDGLVRDVRLESFPDAGAAQAVLDAVRQWSFHPYVVEGRAVPFTGTLEFQINSTDYDRQIRR
ncbi:MAG TPA: TonB family protein [Acidobacteriaceae bacterium]|nr:TonB family protein [Acidobacteriaceae bacterium]